MVKQHNTVFLQEKQRAYQKIKESQVRSKSHFSTMSTLNRSHISDGYKSRIKEKKDYAAQTLS